MTAKEIEELAKGNKNLPETANLNEKYYYSALIVIITLYKLNKISKTELLERQTAYKNVFEQTVLWQKIFKKHLKIERLLSQAELKECETCKNVARILDGRTNVDDF